MSAVLFDPDLGRQARHGRPGFAPYDVTIASPELPCGTSWLASALLELGLPLWRPWGIVDADSWQSLGGARWRYAFPGSGWSRLVPGLVDGREFRLRSEPVPRFTHAWPGQLPSTARLIVFVRDPRDALRSEWMRQRRKGVPEADCTLASFADGRAGGLPLSRRQWIVRYLQAWRCAAGECDTLWLRFEDAKRNPQATLRAALQFIGLRVPARRLAAAVAASDHAAVRLAEQRLLAAGTVPTALLGDGRALDWQGRAADDRIACDPAMAELCEWLGYPTDPAGTAPVSAAAIDATALFAALDQPGVADRELLGRCVAAASANASVPLRPSLQEPLQRRPAVAANPRSPLKRRGLWERIHPRSFR